MIMVMVNNSSRYLVTALGGYHFGVACMIYNCSRIGKIYGYNESKVNSFIFLYKMIHAMHCIDNKEEAGWV